MVHRILLMKVVTSWPEVTRLGEWSTSRRELWGFYLYYLGNNGLSRFNFVNSIILLTNGIRFAIQAVLLLMIGAWADYGTWRCAGD
jgi:hypothetical protein